MYTILTKINLKISFVFLPTPSRGWYHPSGEHVTFTQGVKPAPKGAGQRKDAILAKTQPHKLLKFWFKQAKIAAHTRVRALNVSLSHPFGV